MSKFTILDALKGICALCAVNKNGDKEKPVFKVQGPYSGVVCGPHLHNMVVTQTQRDQNDDSLTLFDRSAK